MAALACNPVAVPYAAAYVGNETQRAAEAGLDAAATDLNGFLDARLAEEGLTPDRLVLLGFSQGAMMSLHVAFRRPTAMAGVVAISGRLFCSSSSFAWSDERIASSCAGVVNTIPSGSA